MVKHYPLPLVEHDKSSWGCLNYYGSKQIICAETFVIKDHKYSFKGGHRVRLYTVSGNVHWKIPAEVDVDIAAIAPAVPGRRQGRS